MWSRLALNLYSSCLSLSSAEIDYRHVPSCLAVLSFFFFFSLLVELGFEFMASHL
jgi:hypothetical protein